MENEGMNNEVLATPGEQMLAAFEANDAPTVVEEASVAPEQETVATPAPMNTPETEAAMQEQVPVSAAPTTGPAMKAPESLVSKEDIISDLSNMKAETSVQEEAKENPAIQFNSEEFLNEFYDNPANAVEKAANIIAENKVKEVISGIENKLQPLLAQSEAAQYREDVKATIGNFLNDIGGDARDMFPDIAQYIKMNNLDPKNKQSYLDAYRESKIGRQGKEIEQLKASQGRNLNDYLNDQASLDEMANNPAVKQKVIEAYIKELNNGTKPATIGVNSTAQPVAQPVNKATTLKEAGAMLREQLAK